jgi:hypothetical protein
LGLVDLRQGRMDKNTEVGRAGEVMRTIIHSGQGLTFHGVSIVYTEATHSVVYIQWCATKFNLRQL